MGDTGENGMGRGGKKGLVRAERVGGRDRGEGVQLTEEGCLLIK